MTPATFVDCFAGAGGFAVGLRAAGLEPRVAFDWNPEAVATYAKNVDPNVFTWDASSLDASTLLETAGLEAGECDLMVGGPPCQGFSRQRRGADLDPRNDLVLEYLRLIAGVRPKCFVMENVAALGGRRGASVLSAFLEGAASHGYYTDVGVVDAADYGTPQNRRRLLVVGVRDARAIGLPRATHTPAQWQTVRNAISDLPCPFQNPDAAAHYPNHERDNISALNRERIAHVPAGGGRDDIPPELRLACHSVSVEKAGHRGVYGRLWWDRPASTITTKCNSFTRGRFAHPDLDRNITMREAARLQGFQDDFVFLGAKVPVAHQIGNAVPPPLAQAIGEHILGSL